MEGGGAVGLLIVLLFTLALAGALTYLYMSFRDHKAAMEKEIKDAQAKADEARKAADDESVNRLGNIKYVVDQVNDVNEEIYSTSTSNESQLRQFTVSNVGVVSSSNNALIRGIDQFFRFSTNNIADGRVFDAGTLDPTAGPKLKLMKEVSIISGMTALDLRAPATGAPGGVMAKFCGSGGANARCISFPNASGDTYLTALEAGKKIVMDAPVNLSNVTVQDGANGITLQNGASTASIKLETDGTLTVQAAKVKIQQSPGQVMQTWPAQVSVSNMPQ